MNCQSWLRFSFPGLNVLLKAAVLAPVAFLLYACAEPESGLSGSELVATYCTSCHLEPVPEQLPKETWPFVLKWMGNYLGFEDLSGELGNGIVNRDIIPDKKIISSGDFEKIEDYFLSKSRPQTEMFAADRRKYEPTTAFSAQHLIRDIPKGEFISLVQFDHFSRFTFVGFGTENNRRLEMYNKQFKKVADYKMKSEPVHLAPFNGGFRLSLIGDFFFDKGEGEVYEVRPGFGKLDIRQLIKGYNRLTQSLAADFNRDGRQDLLVVGFGQGHIGRTSVVHQLPTGGYGDEKILFDGAGSLCAQVRDFDGNGHPDVMLLLAQEHQELVLFLNKGNSEFEKKLLHKEPAGFGYNHFALADINGDKKIDVVTANGNNMEILDAPLKPGHGIRILLNQGDFTFQEEYFFPLHGAIKSIAHDFDKDGDVDIAAIAFYPDWEQENPTTFIYLQNEGSLKFTASTLPVEHWGRWMVMDSADINADGRLDLILGAAYIDKGIAPRHEERYQAWIEKSQPLLFLYNNSAH